MLRVVPHAELMEETETVARQILRNDSRAIRSAKETILNVIGRSLDDQLVYEAFTGYIGAANPVVQERLQRFYDTSDRGRASKTETAL